MNSNRTGISTSLFGMLLGGVLLFANSQVVAQNAGETSAEVAGLHLSYLGPGGCYLCHAFREKASEFQSNAYCALDEYTIWEEQDVHRHAYEQLLSKPAQKMAERLGWKPEDTVKREECLSCHTGLSTHLPELPAATVAAPAAAFQRAGVSCEACHGPASLWIDRHWKPVDWRGFTTERKLHEYGFRDIRSASGKAQLCYSCHIGDPEQNRVVTHAMYAAGHPPLPGIEISRFEDSMPAHWRQVREKPEYEYRDEFVRENYSGTMDLQKTLPRFRASVIGGLTAYRQSLALMSGTATATQHPDATAVWPELAVFDCQSCHHALRSPAVRQTFGYGQRIPGRPMEFQWPGALLEVSLQAIADREQLRDQLADGRKRLLQALNHRPFGAPEELAEIIGQGQRPAEGSLLHALDLCIDAVAQTDFERDEAIAMLKRLCFLGPEAYPDFHSARQLAWTVQTLLAELQLSYPELRGVENLEDPLATAQVTRDLDRFRMFRQERQDLQSRSDAEWNSVIELALPVRDADAGLAESLPQTLSAARNFDPFALAEYLRGIPERHSELFDGAADR